MGEIAWLMSIQITSLTSRRDSRWDRSNPWGKHPKLSKTVKNCFDWRCQSRTCWSPTVQVCVNIQDLWGHPWVINSQHIHTISRRWMVLKFSLSQMTLVCMCIWTHWRICDSAHNEGYVHFPDMNGAISAMKITQYHTRHLLVAWCAAMAIENQNRTKVKTSIKRVGWVGSKIIEGWYRIFGEVSEKRLKQIIKPIWALNSLA